MPAEKKRHHYVPQTYLRSFCDASGRLCVYRKDKPSQPLHVAPNNVAFRRYYYSQPRPDGGVDNNRLEEVFSSLESDWPALLDRLERRESINNSLAYLFEFVALQRVRVPASRDVTEARLAAQVKGVFNELRERGKLPPPPPGLDLDAVQVSIDPHKSIHGMLDQLMREVAIVLDAVGVSVIHNTSSTAFLTSDNPVIWFDPTVPQEQERPYRASAQGDVLLLFPLTPKLLLMGDSRRKDDFARHGLLYGEIDDDQWVARINEQVCRYAYEAVFASTAGHESPFNEFASISPVADPEDPHGPLIFGSRTRLPKWSKAGN